MILKHNNGQKRALNILKRALIFGGGAHTPRTPSGTPLIERHIIYLR